MKRLVFLTIVFSITAHLLFGSIFIQDFKVLKDSSGELEVKAMSLKSFQIPNYERQLSTKATYWIKYIVPSSVVINYDYILLTSQTLNLKVYAKKDNGFVKLYDLEEDSNSIYRFHLFKIPQKYAGQELFFKVNVGHLAVINGLGITELFSGQELIKRIIQEYSVFIAFFSAYFLISLLSLALFLRTREKLYLFYFCYVFFAALFSAVVWGFVFRWIPSINFGNQYFLEAFSFPYSMMTIFLLLYSQAFLNTKKRMPVFHLVINFMIIIKIILFFGGLLSPIGNKFFFYNPNTDTALLLPAFIACIVSYFKKVEFSPYFFLAFTLVFSGIFLHGHSLFKMPVVDDPIFYFLFAEAIVFFLGLTDRFRILQNERQKAMKEKVEQMTENERIKDAANRDLEAKVAERTQLLKVQAIEIEKMNALLQIHNLKLEKDVKDLSKARVTHTPVSFDEFKQTYPDGLACLNYLMELKWGKGFTCRKCGNSFYMEGKTKDARRCNNCWYEETPTIGTVFHRLKFPVEKAFYLLFLVTNNKKISVDELSARLDLSKRTSWNYKNKILESIESKRILKKQELSWEDIILS